MKLNCISISFLLAAFLLFFSPNNIFSQDIASDSTFYQKALVNAMAVYHQSFGTQSALYNGSKYAEYPYKFNDGDPFFYSPLPAIGSVIYDGILYDSILMRYDEITDVLVIHDQADRIQLLSEKVQEFKLYNSDFVRLVKDSLSTDLLSTGFYNLLYKGNVCLFKKQVKTTREVISNILEVEHFADKKDYYYLKKDGRIYQIKRSDDLYELFADKRKEVQQFVKTSGLSFRKDRQNMLTKTTAYYDSLKK